MFFQDIKKILETLALILLFEIRFKILDFMIFIVFFSSSINSSSRLFVIIIEWYDLLMVAFENEKNKSSINLFLI